jgi:hypothetical protein
MELLTLRNIPIPRTKAALLYEPDKEKKYDRLPDIYCAKTWPKRTNIHCYMCTNQTRRIPLIVPSTINADGSIYRGGNPMVCSPTCGMNWILSKARDDQEIRRYIHYFKIFIKNITGCTLDVIHRSMDKLEMNKYGGTLTQHEYEREIIAINEPYIRNQYESLEDYEDDRS